MTLQEIQQLVDETMRRMPAWVTASMTNVAIIVDEEPDPALADGETDLLGYYTGIPLIERGVDYAGELPDVIYIFRRPHLALGLATTELQNEIVTTLVHEIAHYFGFDDDRLGELGWD